tara:strand:- start:190 stop:483 length:294 start_codon:yes stop_codon:yes gene_type:complete
MVDSGEWNALLDGWKYDDIDPLHIDHSSIPNDFNLAGAITSGHSDFSTGYPSFYLKYNGMFHDLSGCGEGGSQSSAPTCTHGQTAEDLESAIDSIVG